MEHESARSIALIVVCLTAIAQAWLDEQGTLGQTPNFCKAPAQMDYDLTDIPAAYDRGRDHEKGIAAVRSRDKEASDHAIVEPIDLFVFR